MVADTRRRGLLLALLTCLPACPRFPGLSPPPPGDGGTASKALGPCDGDGGCPANAYCEPLLTQCYGNAGVAVQLAQGNCYLDNPCNPDCAGVGCGSDLDCGNSMSCQGGICASVDGGFGSTSGPTTECPAMPSVCPPGCGPWSPVHGCEVCLCPTCPWADAG